MNHSFRENRDMGQLDCFPDRECMSRSAVQIRFHSMRRVAVGLFASILCSASIPALGQYQGRIKKDADTTPPLRATGVFEWTGDFNKPKAGRLIPVAVWD